MLAGYFCDVARRRLGIGPVRLTAEAADALSSYAWPGNVRELENVISRAVLRAAAQVRRGEPVILQRAHVGPEFSDGAPAPGPAPERPEPRSGRRSLQESVRDHQRELIRRALAEGGNSWAQAARILGMDPGNLHHLAGRLGMTPRKRRERPAWNDRLPSHRSPDPDLTRMKPFHRSGRTSRSRLALLCWLLTPPLTAGSLASCRTDRPLSVCASPGPANPTIPLETDPGARGIADLAQVTVLGFSQVGNPDPPDPQVLQLDPDMLMRGWQRWDRSGRSPSDYNAAYPAAARAQGIVFIGGSTASALYRDEAATEAEFRSLVACDTRGQPVLHGLADTAFYRASLASPAYRQRLVAYGKMQIDAGVDGLFYDEISSSYDGARWDGNEGFDDAHVADFGGFLCGRYGDLGDEELASRFRLAPGELDCNGALQTRGRSFDYRAYLLRNGWLDAPLSAANPLAAEWGRTLGNRPDPSVGSFVETYPSLVYWQEIVVALRSYAREVYGREIFLTSNGIYPFVDFQSVGLYDWNKDGPGGAEVNYVPVAGGHLDGAASLLPTFLGLKQRSARIAGPDVRVALFLDWPTATMNRYTGLPFSERKDYFRIFLAEAYAAGLLYALPLRTTTGEPTAAELGMMDFFVQLASFYRAHADLYHGALDLADPVTVSQEAIAAHLARLGDGRTVLHLVNHDYAAGLRTRTGVAVSFPAPQAPTSVTLVSPDLTSDAPATFTYAGGLVHVDVGQLDAYVAVVVQ